MNIHDHINIKQLIAEFPAITYKEFQARFRKLKIGHTGDFANDFDVIAKESGNGMIVEIFYRYYANFTAMGVGNGVKLEDRGIQRLVGGGRKAKNWRKGIGHTRHRLAELYLDKLGDGVESLTDQYLTKKMTFKM